MFDESFRRMLPAAAGPLTRTLARRGVSPHAVTWSAFVVALAAAVLIAVGHPFVGLAIWLVSRLGDGLDGLLAREAGKTSAFGAYLDITLDMAAYSAMVIGFSVAHPELHPAWAAILTCYALSMTTTLALSNAATAVGRTISQTNRLFQFTTNLAEAGETSIMYALWVVVPHWLPWLTWTWVAIIIVAVAQRTRLAWRVLR